MTDEDIVVFAGAVAQGAPVTDQLSDDRGVYQVMLAAGEYQLCTAIMPPEESCTAVELTADAPLARWDWNAESGWFQE